LGLLPAVPAPASAMLGSIIIIIIFMANNYNICYQNLPILSMQDTETKDTPTHSPIYCKFQAQSQATPNTNTSPNNSVVLLMYVPKDTGAIELMGGVSKTCQCNFVPEPDIK
jgi:hypothetical protein